ncbi:MAG: 1-deoxy-D-xylulose-5-phosphate reductoisomerase [Candidatus Zixiibacteriota bacterium]
MRRIALFGSTGSIGASLLDIVRKNRSRYQIVLLSSNRNAKLLLEQAREFAVGQIHLFDESSAAAVQSDLPPSTNLYSSRESIPGLIRDLQCELVVNAIVGAAGLEVSYYSLDGGIDLALANKESMVAGGELLRETAARSGAKIIPIDSEHSAIFQCLFAGKHDEVEKLILTSSGGPFRTRPLEGFSSITRSEALRHPNWSMGSKITIDSATMMNKGLEVIEARHLFDIDADAIEIVVHPQSVVHSMVQFHDGSVVAQMSPPDMRLPIAYALEYPNRLLTNLPRLDFSIRMSLDFEPPDERRFPSIALAYNALRGGSFAPLVLNAANEIAVAAFLAEKIKFMEIPATVESVLGFLPAGSHLNLGDLLEADREARERATELIKRGTLATPGR